MGMLTAEELSQRLPSPGSAAHYKMRKENPDLLAQAEALREQRRAEMSKPSSDPYAGMNTATYVRGNNAQENYQEDPEMFRGAFLRNFEAQVNNSGDPNRVLSEDNADYRRFKEYGFELSPEEKAALVGVSGTRPTEPELTFGGSTPAPSVFAQAPQQPQQPQTAPQAQQLDQNFVSFLNNLGLGSLVDLFNGGGVAAVEPTVQPVDFSETLIPKNTVGYDPSRGLYNVPDALQSTTASTGLFNFINPPAPMAPSNPMEGIQLPYMLSSLGGLQNG